jgi:hypothetical protein
MAANVLNSEQLLIMSVRVVRAFIVSTAALCRRNDLSPQKDSFNSRIICKNVMH